MKIYFLSTINRNTFNKLPMNRGARKIRRSDLSEKKTKPDITKTGFFGTGPDIRKPVPAHRFRLF